jgi:metal-dependent amidase/aminoacylase/carboxypeptidase family protein
MTERKVPGRIKLFGTPAEEVGPPAKAIMWKAGVFKGTDILVRSHASGSGTRHSTPGFGTCCLNINAVKYVFRGRPAHQMTSWNGRNALEAAVMFYTGVDRLRSSMRPEVTVQGVIPEGGVAPNVVPDRAVVDFYIRYPDEVYLAHVDSMMADAARGAALATGTEVAIERYAEYRDGITLGTLDELQWAYVQRFGARKLVSEPGRPAGYEETGWVTREVPGVSVSVSSSDHANHTYEMTADNYTEVGHTAFLIDAKTEAGILFDFLTNAGLRRAVKTEHAAMAALFDRYVASLRDVYAPEIGGRPRTSSTARP